MSGPELRLVYAEAIRDSPDDMLDPLEIIGLRYITITERNRQSNCGGKGKNMEIADKAI